MKHTFTFMFCAVFILYTQAQEPVYHMDDGKWSNDFAVPGISGNIYAMTTDGTNLYVGGNFISAGSTIANSVAMWDGTRWHSIGEGLQNGVKGDVPTVHAMAFLEGKLFIGGQFSKAGDIHVNGMAYWDGNHWNRTGTDSINGVTRKVVIGKDTLVLGGFVYSLLAHNGKIYAGGDFEYAGNCKTNALAAWNVEKSEWEIPGDGIPDMNEHSGAILFSLAAHDSIIYAGGTFHVNVNGVPAKNIIALNGNKWLSIGEAKSYVMDMKTGEDGTLYAAGMFSPEYDSGGSATGIGIWDGTEWKSLNGPPQYTSYINRLQLSKNILYAGGTFSQKHHTPDKSMACWDGSEWQIIEGLNQTRYPMHQATVSRMMTSAGKFFVAGSFTRAGETFALNIAELDTETLLWKVITDGNANMGIHDGRIMTLEQQGDTLYAGGDFTVAGGVSARGIAMWTGTEWKPLGTGTYEYNGIGGLVYSILADGKDVFAGGYFDMAGGEAAFNIARWDGSKWRPMGIGVGGVPGAEVRAIAKRGNYVYAAGYFSVAGDAENYKLPANSIARYNLATDRWETLGRGIEYIRDIPGQVNDLEWHGDTLFVGGEFYNADELFTENIAALVNDKWIEPDKAHTYGIHGKVFKIRSIGNELYIGGLLKTIDNGESHGILKWKGGYWDDVGDKLSAGNEDVYVNDIMAFDSGFVAGGFFRLAGGLQVNNLAYFDGDYWKPVIGGVLPGVSCLAATHNNLYVAGPNQIFTNAGLSMGFARLRFDPPVIIGKEDIVNTGNKLTVYPNPSREAARLTFLVNEPGNVIIHIFDNQGKQIMTVLNEKRPAGEYTVGLDTYALPQGIYLCRVVSGNHSETVKFLVR